jgi:hypothetical protein
MSEPTTALIERIDKLHAEATPAPWSHHPPGCCRAIDYQDGVICQMMNEHVDMADATGHAPTREQAQINMQVITALFNAWPAIRTALELAESQRAALQRDLEEAREVNDASQVLRMEYLARAEAAERALAEAIERCAAVCDAEAKQSWSMNFVVQANKLAAAIRALKLTEER